MVLPPRMADLEVTELRKPIIAGNWKMNMTWASAVKTAQIVGDQISGTDLDDVEVVLCPPFTSIKGVSNVREFDRAHFEVGAQDVHWEAFEGSAACTGEISASMLVDLGCAYCIVGHSERRADNAETDEKVNLKAKVLIDHGIVPIICCGESEATNARGESVEFVSGQIRRALDGIGPASCSESVIAYEPIWAIGTGKVPTPESAASIVASIRSVVADMVGSDAAAAIRVLYGGSMKPENAAHFLQMEEIDGGLVGGASLDALKFVEIVRICREAKLG